jgi:hypothetical protein
MPPPEVVPHGALPPPDVVPQGVVLTSGTSGAQPPLTQDPLPLPEPPHPQLHVPKAVNPEVSTQTPTGASSVEDMDTAFSSASSVGSLRWFYSPDHTQEVNWERSQYWEGENHWEEEEEEDLEDEIFQFFQHPPNALIMMNQALSDNQGNALIPDPLLI